MIPDKRKSLSDIRKSSVVAGSYSQTWHADPSGCERLKVSGRAMLTAIAHKLLCLTALRLCVLDAVSYCTRRILSLRERWRGKVNTMQWAWVCILVCWPLHWFFCSCPSPLFFLPELRKVIPTTTTLTHGLESFDIFVSFGRWRVTIYYATCLIPWLLNFSKNRCITLHHNFKFTAVQVIFVVLRNL